MVLPSQLGIESPVSPISFNGGINSKLRGIAYYVYSHFPPVRNPQSDKMSSPTTSHSSLPIEGKSKYELQEIAHQLMLQASQMNEEDDIDSSSKSKSSTCQPRMPSSQKTPIPKMRWSDYPPDSQDPYDFNPFDMGKD
ncbi:hypothetical protein L3X38_009934 [Prunus dulcis]|uniref:Uncharacterized protein n=1 Tax=Prunus dulcis TaxID=3755 RepID=A0AAD4WEU0_PRUDU|nr:hypothetical protein L3X38_009934 [Prunus dulcis]